MIGLPKPSQTAWSFEFNWLLNGNFSLHHCNRSNWEWTESMTDFDDFASGKLPHDKMSKIARGEPLTATEEFARGQGLSASDKLVRDYRDLPSVKHARDYADTPAAKLARDFGQSPAAQLANRSGRSRMV